MMSLPSVSVFPEGQGFVSEDEYLEISDIKRDQSGEYECSALNDVAAPDVRKVKITVNCESVLPWASHGERQAQGAGCSAVPLSERPTTSSRQWQNVLLDGLVPAWPLLAFPLGVLL